MSAASGLSSPLELLQRGRLEEAWQACEAQIAAGDDPAAAFNLQGVVAMRRHDWPLACERLERAISCAPTARGPWLNLGICRRRAGEPQPAIQALSRALELKPGYARAAFQRGGVYLELGEPERALADFELGLRSAPGDAQAWSQCGAANRALGREGQAATCYERAAQLRPDWAHAHLQAGRARTRNGQAAMALPYLEQALRLAPDDASAHFALGLAHDQLGQFDLALAGLERASALLGQPEPAALMLARGNALTRAGELQQALSAFDEALRLYPELPQAHCNRALVLDNLNRVSEARAGYARALELGPGLAEVHLDYGRLLVEHVELEPAERAFSKSLALQPDSPSAALNLGLVHLMRGKLDTGWALYESRHRQPAAPAPPALVAGLPRWSAADSVHGTLVWGEQGIGDQILHGSLLADFAQHHGPVTVALDRRLLPLFERSLPGIRFVSLAREGQGLGCTHQLPIGSLGGVVRTTLESFPAEPPAYLQADAAAVSALREQLGIEPGQRVCGLSWKTIRRGRLDPKSIPLRELLAGLPREKLLFVNLQYGDVQEEVQAVQQELGVRIVEVPGLDRFMDLDRLAALVAACDVVLTSSNTTAHLAGALGRPTCVLLHQRFGRIWYWVHRQGRRSLWYPSVQVFIQQTPGDWQEPLNEAAQAIAALASPS